MHRTPIAIVGAALLALTGCTEAPEDPLDERVDLGLEADEDDEARLQAALQEGMEVGGELDAILNRLMRRCLEDKGFTVHDETELFLWPSGAEGDLDLLDFQAPVEQIPTAEEAAENGFMVWAETYDGSELAPEDEVPDYMQDYYNTMEGPWYDLSDEERLAWNRAYFGPAVVAWRDSNDTDEERLQEPEPGGCDGEMHSAVYGEPTRITDVEDPSVLWEWGEPNPLWVDWDYYDDIRDWRDLTREEERAFLVCLDADTEPGWDFNQDGYVDPFFYVHAFYPPDPANAGIEFDPLPDAELAAMPEIPADAPYDYDTAFAAELALATAFAACADDTGYREAGRSQWRAMNIGRMLEHESEVYAWQEQMYAYLETAQALLES
ncbi:hypothetical protein [Glycomyces paridis]|uniref:Uncharacterized protein n=1 Tax=Glycomyces paridis TaxID=2126555 RepID=A0A4S8PJU4_9ACTN|nr:hypothetical protein [Glycomyces paridis]THV28709.1 hypothetical protein E9998_11425 [Glycomyces paridis]